MDIEILCKMPNDSLEPAILVLKNTCFECVDPETDELINRKYIFDYANIAEIVMRARHEHMDIKFHDGTDRFRLMSSYLQILTNELYIRCNAEIVITFEPGAKEFEFDDARISVVPPSSREKNGGFSRFGAFASTSSLLSDGADQETIDNLDTTDKHLEQISRLVNQTNNVTISMGSEIDRQTNQLDRINGKVDNNNERLKQQNKKISKISANV